MLYFFRKFKHDLYATKKCSNNFNLLLHCELWFKDKFFKQSPIEAGFPWINYAIIQFLHHFLLKDMKVLEFGSGGSSIFFIKRGVKLISIEHEPRWLNDARIRLTSSKIRNWETHLISSKLATNGIPTSQDYLNPIRKIPDSSIDLVLVDGRHRVDCVKHSLSKVKPNGYIILDNSDRPEYSKTFETSTGVAKG